MIDDYIDIVTGDVHFEPNENGGGQIKNSYKVQNPVIVLWYSYKLKSKYGDTIKGSPQGVAAEWILHNTLYDIFYLPSRFSFCSGWLESAQHTDIGYTSFNDSWVVAIPTITIQYVLNKQSVIIDFYIYNALKKGEKDE
jgi:hypothetical protein